MTDADSDRSDLRRGTFDGPAHAPVRWRVAMAPAAFADITAHARADLEREVAGVLVGTMLEDDDGAFLRVDAAVRAEATDAGARHVTFTQETWNTIHEQIERDHKGARIVGWYHTHPGFGVEFSEMDRFVQQNFFGAPGMIALVTDPLGGGDAVLANAGGDLVPLDRIWIGGREKRLLTSGFDGAAPPTNDAGRGAGADLAPALERLETRVQQLVIALDEERRASRRFVTIAVALLGLLVTGAVIWTVLDGMNARWQPPKLRSVVPVAIDVEGEPMLIGVGVYEYVIPDSLRAALPPAPESEPDRSEAADPAKGTGDDAEGAADDA